MIEVNSISRRYGAAWLSALAFAIVGSGASAASLSEIAMSTGPDRQAKLEAGAKAEGELILYTTLIVNQAVLPLKAGFEKKYPYIKFSYTRASTNALVLKIMNEMRAGKSNADVIVGSTHQALKKAAYLVPFTSPELADYLPESLVPDHLWVNYRMTYYGIGYNTKLVSEADAPNKWEDLTDAKFKGKLVWNKSREGAYRIIAHIRNVMGKKKAADFLDKLAGQKVAASTASRRAILDLVVAGEYSAMMGATLHHVIISKSKGAPAWFTSPSPVVGRPDAVQLPKDARHPHAAMLFIDFLLGKEGQEVLAKARYLPSNIKVDPLPELRPIIPHLTGKKLYIVDDEDLSAQLNDIKKIFAKISP